MSVENIDVEVLRAIVRDLADCPRPGDHDYGACLLCDGVGTCKPECPYRRAVEASGA